MRKENFSLMFKLMFKSHRKTWRQLASEIKAEYIDKGAFKSPQVIKRGEGFEITLDSYTKHVGNSAAVFTQYLMSVENPNHYHIILVRKNWFNAKAPKGTEKIENVNLTFDKHFRLFTSDKRLARQLFSWQLMSDIDSQQPYRIISLELKEDQFKLVLKSLNKDLNQLKSLFILMETIHNQFYSEF